MAGIIKASKVIDTKNRVTLPREWGRSGEYVCFEITKSGNLLLRKIKTESDNKEVPTPLENYTER